MELKVATPCPIPWETMTGDDRIRYCGHCKLSVYNLAVMSPPEVEQIVREKEGKLCGRLFMRGDRTATAEMCPKSRFRRNLRRLLTAAAVLMFTAFAWFLRSVDGPPRSVHPQWIQQVLDWIDPQPRHVVGKMVCPTPNPAPTPSTPDEDK